MSARCRAGRARARSGASLSWAVAALLCVTAGDALAQPVGDPIAERVPVRAADPLLSPGRALASIDEAPAVALNPANLAFLPAPELRWTWLAGPDDSKLSGRGHAIDAAAPLWIVGTGLRVEALDPTLRAALPSRDDLRWVRWGLGARLGDAVGLGASLGWSLADSPRLDGQLGATLGVTLRPRDTVSAMLVVRDVNEPLAADGRTRTSRAWDAGFALRPLAGRRSLELGLEGRLVEQGMRGAVRTTLGVEIPDVGRLVADASWFAPDASPAALTASAGLELAWGSLVAGGGARLDSTASGAGAYATAALRGWDSAGLPGRSLVARIDIDQTPGVRGHFRLLRRLWRLARRDDVEGVALVLRSEPASSLAHAEELGDAIRTLRAAGKKVACHLEDASGKSLFVCSQADAIAIHPAGGVRFAGLASRYTYLGGLLEKLGIEADFVRIGAHKTAAELYAQPRGSDVARADHQALVDRYAEILEHDVGGGRRIPRSRLRATLAKGPFLASEALEAGLVDALVYPDELDDYLERVFGHPVALRKRLPLVPAPVRWGTPGRVAVVYLAGDMIDGESRNIPIVGVRLAGSRTIVEALTAAREDPTVKAVVFRVETGGGSSLAADVILREVRITAEKKPVIVSMGTAAASGGYYVAVGGTTIWANRSTLTGSIGIFYGKVDLTGLLSKLGVRQDAFRSSPRADLETLYRPFTDDERAALGEKIKRLYDQFVAHVAEGRRLPPEAVDAVARGRVWTGDDARDRGLVDRLGGFREAIEEARKLGGLDDDAPLLELPEEDDSLLGFLLELAGVRAEATPVATLVPAPLLDAARAVAPFLAFGDDRPLARVDLFEAGDYPLVFAAEPPGHGDDE